MPKRRNRLWSLWRRMHPNPMARACFITLEGGEGTGKSTQAARLQQRLQACGLSVLRTREPGGTPLAEAVRNLLLNADFAPDALTEVALFMAARRDHVQQIIQPALARGQWVICDRFEDSTLAYQAHARGMGEAFVEQGYRWLMGSFIPDATLILDMPVETALARARAAKQEFAAGDRFEQEALAFHQRLQQAFRQIAAREPARCAVIDAEGCEDAVHERLWQALVQRVEMPCGTA